MKAPVEGAPGAVWRLVTLPLRALAPAVSIASRIARSRLWVDTEERRTGNGPQLEMSSRADIQRPRDGAGPLNHRTYRVYIVDSLRTPTELIDAFCRNPNEFSPTSFATFDPPPGPAGMAVGDELTVRLPGPWDGPVVVTVVEPELVKFETRESHMEAGSIRFTSRSEGEKVIFEIESIARSGDPLFDALYHPGKVGKWVQTEMWVRVLEAALAFSGGQISGRPTVDTITYEGPVL